MNWFTRYVSDRGWRINDTVPDHARMPKMEPFPVDAVIRWASVPNQRGWEMSEDYREEHYDRHILASAKDRLGPAYATGFMGELVLIDCEHPSLALRGIDYARVAVLRPVASAMSEKDCVYRSQAIV